MTSKSIYSRRRYTIHNGGVHITKYFELGASIGKKGAYRLIRDATTKKEISEFVKNHADESVYFSVYTFAQLTDGKCEYASAICDKIFIEIDSPGHSLITEEAWRDLRLLIDWCKLEEKNTSLPLRPQIFFSGSSGYHILFHLPKEMFEYKNQRVIQRLTNRIKTNSGCQHVDLGAAHGFSQLRRIPNTLNHKSGYYCIPLTLDEAYNLGPSEIIKLASKKRKINNFEGTSDYFVDVIKMMHKLLDRDILDDKLRYTKETKVQKYVDRGHRRIRPCIFRLLKLDNPNFYESTTIATELLRVGYTIDEVCTVFQCIRKDKYIDKMTRDQVSNLKRKNIFAPSCTTLREKNYCKFEYHIRNGNEHYEREPIDYLEETNAKETKKAGGQ